ncbi:hypothetical protein NSQ45_02695 [Caldifermentibacillus hisashii]|uniref:hypothetical protein n=1 Tax=Caldifermentibacillus hisashii TaxID=996558 RepID=UPI0034D59456
MVTKTSLVVKNKRFSTKSGDENEAHRQKQAFLTQKWRRKRGSSPKTSVSHSKMVTKTGLVVKNKRFSTKSGDENEAHRQKQAFLNQKWRRKRVSSPKTSFSHSKMVTRTDLVAKNMRFLPKNGDENWGSSSKRGFSQPKVATKTRLIAKNKLFSLKNGDENESRRQKRAFLTEKW